MPGPWDGSLTSPNAATITANTNHTGFFAGDGVIMRAELAITGTVSGTSPTLDVKLQDSADGTTYADFSPVHAFPQQTATGARLQQEVQMRVGRPYLRAVSTVGGATPSFGGTSVRYGVGPARITTAAAS